METTAVARNTIDALAEEFSARLRRGERPCVEEYVERCRKRAHEIRELFPAVAALAAAAEPTGDTTLHDPHKSPPDHAPGERLGEYRLVRVLGRGGMGVVYEAVQEPLGRRVALKLMSNHGPLLPTQRERFRREAQAAARLHHTNIVPVFDCGEQDGVPFYAMQYIDGRGLDDALADLHAEGSFSSTSSAHWRSVARIGLQVADALAYAHREGVLHRDIKPANLLLDRTDRVWVTDFGLAKASDQKDLTATGSLLGTLRYMAPEGLAGNSDARSDVCSLGLTLYELIAGRPAYDQPDRAQLLDALAHKQPPALSRVRPDVSRDLETIVHKAMDRLPQARYSSAAELADDLRRFLAGEPIRARKISLAARTVRWTKRKPVVASLTATVALLVLCGMVATGVATLKFRDLADKRRAAMEAAQRERAHAVDQSQTARRAEQLALRRLYDARVAEAAARQASGQPGQRFETLQAVREATGLLHQLGLGEDERLTLRNLAVGGLSLPDLATEQEWDCLGHEDIPFDFSPQLDLYAIYEPDQQSIVVRRTTDQETVQRIPVAVEPWPIRFSSNGELLAFGRPCSGHRHLQVWSFDQNRLVLRGAPCVLQKALDFNPDGQSLAVCDPRGGVVVYDLAGGMPVKRFATKQRVTSVAYSPRGDRIAVGRSDAGVVDVYNADANKAGSQQPARSFSLGDERGSIDAIAWSKSENYLAAGCGTRIVVWHTDAKKEPILLEGHHALVIDLAFDPRSDLLLSTAWDNQTRVWEPAGRGLLLEADGALRRVDTRGDRAAVRRGRKLALLRLAHPEVYQSVHAAQHANDALKHAVLHPRGRLLVACGETGLSFHDVRDMAQLAHIPVGSVHRVEFHPEGHRLFSSGNAGILSHDVQWMESDHVVKVRIGPAKRLPLPVKGWAHHMDLDARGETLAAEVSNGGRIVVLDLKRERDPVVIQGDVNLMYVDLSPDGRWAVTGNYHGSRIEVFDAQSGQSVHQIPEHRGSAAFSPDGRWLVLTGLEDLRVLEVGTWRQVELMTHTDVEFVGEYPRFHPQSGEFALAARHRHLMLLDPETGRSLATLAAARESRTAIPTRFSPDGSRLLARVSESSIGMWDLVQLRSELAKMGLDWSTSPLPPPKANSEKPLQLELATGH